MNNTIPSRPARTLQMFLSPQKMRPEPELKHKQQAFVLDCTNPLLSKLPQYQPDRDHFSQSYLTILFSRLRSHKENRSPRLTHQTKEQERTLSGQEFRQYLNSKLNSLNNVSKSQEVLSYLSEGQPSKQIVENKQSVFLEHKFRCFKKKKRGVGASLQT